MDIPLGWQLFIQVILIAVNAVFASAEIAIVSMNELKLEKLAEDGNRRAKRLRKLTEKPAAELQTAPLNDRRPFSPPFRSPLPCPAFWAAPLRRTTSPM